VLNINVVGTSRGRLAIHLYHDLVLSTSIRRIVDFVGSVSLIPCSNARKARERSKFGMDFITRASTEIAFVIAELDDWPSETSKVMFRESHVGVVQVEIARFDVEVDGRILDGYTVKGGDELVLTSLSQARVGDVIGSIAVIDNLEGDDFTSLEVLETPTNVSTTQGKVIVKGITGLDVEFVIMTNRGSLDAFSMRNRVSRRGRSRDDNKREGIVVSTNSLAINGDAEGVVTYLEWRVSNLVGTIVNIFNINRD